jgi:hypothetical protein
MTGSMYLGMLAFHIVVLLIAAGSHEQHSHGAADQGFWLTMGVWGGLALAAVQVALAGGALLKRS